MHSAGDNLAIKLKSGNFFIISIIYDNTEHPLRELFYLVRIYDTGHELERNKINISRLDGLAFKFDAEWCYGEIHNKEISRSNGSHDSHNWLEIAPNTINELVETIKFYEND